MESTYSAPRAWTVSRTFELTPESHEEVTAIVALDVDEGSPVAQGQAVSIGLKNDQIMQRYLVRRIHREVEFLIKEIDGQETIGFITGFDDKCIQMSTTPRHEADEPHSVLIFWPIRRIEETGRLVDDLDHDHKSKIRSYSHALRAQCEAWLNGSKGNGKAPQSPRWEPTPFDTQRRV